jgi:hypothetical protein
LSDLYTFKYYKWVLAGFESEGGTSFLCKTHWNSN